MKNNYNKTPANILIELILLFSYSTRYKLEIELRKGYLKHGVTKIMQLGFHAIDPVTKMKLKPDGRKVEILTRKNH